MAKPEDVLKVAESDLDGDNLLTVKLARKDGEVVLYVQADEMLTDIVQQGREAQSTEWGTDYTDGDSGYKFYKKTGYNDSVKRILNSRNDSYGSRWFQSGKGNIAVLRTKGIEEGKFFKIDQPMTKANLKKIQSDIKEAGDNLIDSFLKDVAFVSEVKQIQAENTVQTAFDGE